MEKETLPLDKRNSPVSLPRDVLYILEWERTLSEDIFATIYHNITMNIRL
jgi:hypothetical protein